MTRTDMFDMMAVGKTHPGSVRTKNEDCFLVSRRLGLFLVADGMGGHASGEVASRTAIETIRDIYEGRLRRRDVLRTTGVGTGLTDASRRFISNIITANRAIFELARSDPKYRGMGTTLAALLARRDHLIQAYVGDSRIYRIRGERIQQLTEDHSLVNEQLRMGLLTEDEAKFSLLRNVITRALGIMEDVEVDVERHQWMSGDTYLLCTDGLSDLVGPDEILTILGRESLDLDAACDALIQTALDRGGHDNITVVLLRLGKMLSRSAWLTGRLKRVLGKRRRAESHAPPDRSATSLRRRISQHARVSPPPERGGARDAAERCPSQMQGG